MPILYINTGTAPNQGNGDTLRLAFTKINNNFSLLSRNAISADMVGSIIENPELQHGVSVTYNSSTQKASFILNTATSIKLGGVKIGYGITIDPNTGVISAFDSDYNHLINIPQSLGIFDSPTFYNLHSTGTIYQGTAYDNIEYTDTSIRVDTDTNSFAQMIMKNHNTGTRASTDLVIMNDQGDNFTNILDLGINSSNYKVPQYGITSPGDGYLFTSGGNLVIGTQSPDKKIIFHAGGTTITDATAEFNQYSWKFNRKVEVDVNTPSPLKFSAINRSANVVATTLFEVKNDVEDTFHFGITSSNYQDPLDNSRLGANQGFLHFENSSATIHIGSTGDLVFYSNQIDSYAGTPTLFMSSLDQSSTFDGSILPAETLTSDLGSTSNQWRHVYADHIFVNGTEIKGTDAAISLVDLKTLVANSTDFADFQARIAVL